MPVIEVSTQHSLLLAGNDSPNSTIDRQSQSITISNNGTIEDCDIVTQSEHYIVGDLIDCFNSENGAWFEAKIVRIMKFASEYKYELRWDRSNLGTETTFCAGFDNIRPRAWEVIIPQEISLFDVIMLNYNLDDHNKVGLWYDFVVYKITVKNKDFKLRSKLKLSIGEEKFLYKDI